MEIATKVIQRGFQNWDTRMDQEWRCNQQEPRGPSVVPVQGRISAPSCVVRLRHERKWLNLYLSAAALVALCRIVPRRLHSRLRRQPVCCECCFRSNFNEVYYAEVTSFYWSRATTQIIQMVPKGLVQVLQISLLKELLLNCHI
jgi:hypothetical protein